MRSVLLVVTISSHFQMHLSPLVAQNMKNNNSEQRRKHEIE